MSHGKEKYTTHSNLYVKDLSKIQGGRKKGFYKVHM